MIYLGELNDHLKSSKAVLMDRRKTLLSFLERYLHQIEEAEKKITEKSSPAYVKKVNDQRLFIDSMIDYLQEVDTLTQLWSGYIRELMEYYETEIKSGCRITHNIEFWKNQALMHSKGKKNLIKAFSRFIPENKYKDFINYLTDLSNENSKNK